MKDFTDTDYTGAAVKVAQLRVEVVTLVGICGYGTHPLTEILDQLKERDISPSEAVAEATRIREKTIDFR